MDNCERKRCYVLTATDYTDSGFGKHFRVMSIFTDEKEAIESCVAVTMRREEIARAQRSRKGCGRDPALLNGYDLDGNTSTVYDVVESKIVTDGQA